MTRLGKVVGEAVDDALRSGAFDTAIEGVIVSTIRNGRDADLSRTGFILKMAVEIMDRSKPPIGFQRAQVMAADAFRQFLKENKGVKFGCPGWDWSGAAARQLIHEYEIDYWEPVS